MCWRCISWFFSVHKKLSLSLSLSLPPIDNACWNHNSHAIPNEWAFGLHTIFISSRSLPNYECVMLIAHTLHSWESPPNGMHERIACVLSIWSNNTSVFLIQHDFSLAIAACFFYWIPCSMEETFEWLVFERIAAIVKMKPWLWLNCFVYIAYLIIHLKRHSQRKSFEENYSLSAFKCIVNIPF